MIPQLQTERLTLRTVRPGDQAFVFEGLSHPDVIKHYGVSYISFEATQSQMDWYESLQRTGTGASWIMQETETAQPIGDISVYRYEAAHHKAEIGFWLLPQFWNKGFALEALQAVLEYWKTGRDLHRMEAFVETENAASAKLLEKAGFAHEGIMSDCEIKNGRYISLHVYGLLFQ